MDVTRLEGRCALVTGAASGIGRATALALARRGADLFLCDLDEKGLAETAASAAGLGRTAHTWRVDVADRAAMEAFAAEVHQRVAAVDVLVNNAGVGLGGEFVDVPLDDWSWIVGVNLMGVVTGCHLFVPPMLARGAGGHVVNIASMAAYTPAPGMSAYCATKSAVLGFSECLRLELAASDVGVTVVCPGVIDTPIVRTSRFYGAQSDERVRERAVEAFRRRNYSPERVADGILAAVQRNKAVAPISPEARGAYLVKRLLPWLVYWAGGRAAQRVREQAS